MRVLVDRREHLGWKGWAKWGGRDVITSRCLLPSLHVTGLLMNMQIKSVKTKLRLKGMSFAEPRVECPVLKSLLSCRHHLLTSGNWAGHFEMVFLRWFKWFLSVVKTVEINISKQVEDERKLGRNCWKGNKCSLKLIDELFQSLPLLKQP